MGETKGNRIRLLLISPLQIKAKGVNRMIIKRYTLILATQRMEES